MTRRDFMRRAAAAGLALGPAAVAGGATSSGIQKVSAREFFPSSEMPEAVRERLANRLLGRLRVTDPAFDDYYRRVAAELSPNDDFLIVTAASDDVNAFAHYGGVIVMMRGMWDFAGDEDGLLGIVAHEMGHVKLNHFESRQKLNEQISAISVPLLIAGLLAGSSEVREGIIVGGSGIITGQIYGHSRELEHEADVVGLKLLTGIGRDGRRLSSLLGRLAGADNEYISTHPAPRRRSAYIIDRLLDTRFAPSDSLDFLLLQQKLAAAGSGTPEFVLHKRRDLAAASGDAATALRLGIMLAAAAIRDTDSADKMESALADNPHPFIVAARADYVGRKGSHAAAIAMLESALADNPHPFIVAASADYVGRKGSHAAALAMLESARKMHPNSAALAVKYAQTLRRAGKHRELLSARRDMPEQFAERADILRETSQSASALGRHAEANLLLAAAHLAAGDFELASKQLEIAEKFKMSTKMLVRANQMQNMVKRELASLSENGG